MQSRISYYSFKNCCRNANCNKKFTCLFCVQLMPVSAAVILHTQVTPSVDLISLWLGDENSFYPGWIPVGTINPRSCSWKCRAEGTTAQKEQLSRVIEGVKWFLLQKEFYSLHSSFYISFIFFFIEVDRLYICYYIFFSYLLSIFFRNWAENLRRDIITFLQQIKFPSERHPWLEV